MTNKAGLAFQIFKNKGPKGLAEAAKKYADERTKKQAYKDILFINGCGLPHPQRYRVDHQIEQLEAFGIHCDKVYYEDLTTDILKFYRGFVFYRCPVTKTVEEFIELAKENNKTVFYDIDDLVYDTKYTDEIKYLDTMSNGERKTYDDGVVRMGKTLSLCDYGITTTNRLKSEMDKTNLKEVFINRNVASEEMVKYSKEALRKARPREYEKVVLGYFSGTITHNDDFNLIMPTIVELLKRYKNLYLKIVGLLDLPKEMEEVKDKIIVAPFTDWEKLPELIRSVDINLAPLEDTIFNQAKSENKWTEAALVKVPTVASDVGAFKTMIKNNETGLLCKNGKDWENALARLIENRPEREEIGENAYEYVMKNCTTVSSGKGIAKFISEKLAKNVFFVLPGPDLSGGILVVKKHAEILKAAGFDVNLFDMFDETPLETNIDTAVATMWHTLDRVRKIENCEHHKYLVQSFETGFYTAGDKARIKANATYAKVPGVEYITISKWCKDWLEKDFGNENVKFAENGIDPELFPPKKREFEPGKKIKVLIEGDSKSYYKNVDEAFEIVKNLSKDRYEIHYLSYNGEPKRNYRYDKFFKNVPHDVVGKIYQDCDILLKTSILESFSYPPLEMMATGGLVVVRPNAGNAEYLKDGENCLFYEPGNIENAVERIEKLSTDKKLRERLTKNATKTVAERNWAKIEKEIVKLYT